LEFDPIVLASAADANYVINYHEISNDGCTEFSAGLGEIRYSISTENDVAEICYSERLEPGYLVLAAPSLGTVSRYLLKVFGSSIRQRRKLPRIRVPADADRLASGFQLEEGVFNGEQRLALTSDGSSVVAWSTTDPTFATITLATLSHHMTGSPDEIRSSYLAPSGAPLFARYVLQR
jgi:hypothetical protein